MFCDTPQTKTLVRDVLKAGQGTLAGMLLSALRWQCMISAC